MSTAALKLDRFMSVSGGKAELHALVKRVDRENEVVVLTDHGVPSAVLLSIDQYEGLIETAEILSDRKTLRSLRRSMKQVEKREWVCHETVFGRSKTHTKKS